MSQVALSKILALAERDDIELQCSTIKVIGEIGVKNKKVTSLLLKKLSSSNPVIRKYALSAISKTPSIDYVEYLMDMIEKGDENVRTVEAILCSLGSRVFPLLKRRFTKSPDIVKKIYITCIASIKTVEARNFLLNAILNYPLDILKHICFSLRETVESLSAKEKRSFYIYIKKLIDKASLNKNYIALTSYMILIGYLRLPESKNVLLSFIKKNEREYFHVQRNALLSLSKVHLTGRHDDVANVMFSLVESGDVIIAKHAIQILNTITLSTKYSEKIKSIINSPYPEVRRFAVMFLGRKDSKDSIKQLVSYLGGQDNSVREAAVESLKTMPNSVGMLIKELENFEDIRQGLVIAYILKEHKKKLISDKCTALFAKMEKYFIKNNEKYKLFYNVLRIAVPEFLYKTTLRKVQVLKKRKKFKEAEMFIGLLNSGLLFTDEVKYESAIISLKNSSKDLSLMFRNGDNTLRLFVQLLKSSDIALLKRIKKETVLESDDLFYLGFHFSEKLFELKEFGTEILKYLIKKYPRSKFTVKAKKKIIQGGSVLV